MSEIPLSDLLANAIRYWERCRLLYNGVLALVVAIYFFVAWPESKAAITVDHSLQLFLQAVVANVLYCAAYPADVFAQLSSLRPLWLRYRWVVFAIGLAFASIITRFISMELFQVVI